MSSFGREAAVVNGALRRVRIGVAAGGVTKSFVMDEVAVAIVAAVAEVAIVVEVLTVAMVAEVAVDVEVVAVLVESTVNEELAGVAEFVVFLSAGPVPRILGWVDRGLGSAAPGRRERERR